MHPLSNEELMATLHLSYMALHETGGMWCEGIHELGQTLRKKCCAAFLSEDYEDELVERVREKAFQISLYVPFIMPNEETRY